MTAPEIVYEDKDILVVYKPVGMAVQTKNLRQMDLETYLKNYLTRKGEAPVELHVVHRLDQPVEGLLVFAKNKAAAASLDRQVQAVGDAAKEMEKEYLAAVHGVPEKDADMLTDHLKKDVKTNRAIVVSAKDKQGKKAILSYETIRSDRETGISVLKVMLATGRFHQIRAQLAHAGWPIVGDDKYGSKSDNRQQLALCARRLVFIHPGTKERMEFSCEPKNPLFLG